MNRALVWFAVLYGELTAAVILVVAGGYWVDTASGQSLCAKAGLEALGCKVALSTLVLVITAYGCVSAYFRFAAAKRGENKAAGDGKVKGGEDKSP